MMGDLPRVVGIVARALIRGEGSEFVVGDLAERHRSDLEAGMGRRRARARCLGAVLRSCAAWWAPSAIRRRRRRRRRESGIVHAARTETGMRGQTMGGWLQDLGFATRGLVRRPRFTAGVAVTLGLGIGATTTIFSVVDAVLLRPLHFQDASRLAVVGTTFPTREWTDRSSDLQHLAGMAMMNYMDYAERSRSFDRLSGIEMTNVLLPDDGRGPELVPSARVGPAFFEIFSVRPAVGRTFVADEFSVEAPDVLMISYGAWQRRFAGDPTVVGRSLDKVGVPATIVGVLPADFTGPEAIFGSTPDFWLPLEPDHGRYADRGMRSLYVVGRLAPGAEIEAARGEARTIAGELAAEFPDGNVYPDGSHFGIGVNGLRAQTVGTAARPLRVYLGAAGLLLALAAMNAATLLLARAFDRLRELGVRMALGAGRGRVVRLLLTEAGLLACVGGVVGIALAFAGVGLFLRYAPSSIPRVSEVAVDARVLAVAVVLSLGAGLAAGLLPAIRLSGPEISRRLRGAGVAGGEPASRLWSVLVGAQITIAIMLLSGAGLLFSSFVRIVTVEPGFEPDGLITMGVPLKRPGAPPGEEAWQAWDAVLEELAAVPGVESVAGTTNPPFQAPFWAPRLLLPQDPVDAWREGIAGYAISPGYLETIGATLVSGRNVRRLDGPAADRVALVNEAFVRTQLLGADPIGVVLRQVEEADEVDLRIVGVVGDMVQTRAEEGWLPAVYVPYTQVDWPEVQAVVRTELPPEVIVPELRAAVARFSPLLPPRDVGTMHERMTRTRTTPRFQTLLMGAFALVALLLASLGLYGSLAHAVGRRRRELGVRMALGARQLGVIRLVVTHGMGVVAVGLGLGLLGTLAANRTLAGFLFGVEPNDPWTLLGAVLVLFLVSILACVAPARKATAVDPVEVLRAD